MMELEEGSGTEDSDTQLLDSALIESTTRSSKYAFIRLPVLALSHTSS